MKVSGRAPSHPAPWKGASQGKEMDAVTLDQLRAESTCFKQGDAFEKENLLAAHVRVPSLKVSTDSTASQVPPAPTLQPLPKLLGFHPLISYHHQVVD